MNHDFVPIGSLRQRGGVSMPRMRKILTALFTLVLLSWVGGAVENSLARPSDHSHQPVFSQPNGHQHHDENAGTGKFYCPMHKHRSLTPCPHRHSQKEMAQKKQCKIGPDCGGSPFKSIPAQTGFDFNPAWMAVMSHQDLPGLAGAFLSLRVAYEDPSPISQKHPPKFL